MYNRNQFSFEDFSANKIVEFPDSHILYVANFELKSDINTRKLWSGPITYKLNVNLENRMLSRFEWQSLRSRGTAEDYLLLRFGEQTKEKPDLFIADNYQQLKTRNASIQIATCQLSELNKKDLSQKIKK